MILLFRFDVMIFKSFKVRQFFILAFFLLSGFIFAEAQIVLTEGDSHPIFDLEQRLIEGDKSALIEVADLFDSDEKLVEYLGHHRMNSTVGQIAHRIIKENTLFLNSELNLDENLKSRDFKVFLKANFDRIVYSELATSFLITPLEVREAEIKVRSLTDWRKSEIEAEKFAFFEPRWVAALGVDKLVAERNPKALLVIASVLYRARSRFNRHYYEKEEFTNLLQYLTGTEFGVKDRDGDIIWKIASDFNEISQLNLLIFFAKHYTGYKWDEERAIFVNKALNILEFEKETELLQKLLQKNDSIAMDALVQLSVCDPEKVQSLMDEPKKLYMDPASRFSRVVFDYAVQLAALTAYCRKHELDYEGPIGFQSIIAHLQLWIPKKDRRKLGDSLIHSMTLENITALEYWTLIYKSDYLLPSSTGRILDIFYSKHWNTMVSNQKYLEAYLKKSSLFRKIPVIGCQRKYLRKFANSPESTKESLSTLVTDDPGLKEEIRLALEVCNEAPAKYHYHAKPRILRRRSGVSRLEQRLRNLTMNVTDSAMVEGQLTSLISRISYQQIKVAILGIAEYPFTQVWYKYSFMKDDFGFIFQGDLETREGRQAFFELYDRMSQFELYSYLLDQLEIDYKTSEGRLDFDKVYELLKFGVWESFLGGDGNELESYSVIKLLELTFNKTLGFDDKLCRSENHYRCSSFERAQAWMHYLEKHELLQHLHDEPQSFNAK